MNAAVDTAPEPWSCADAGRRRTLTLNRGDRFNALSRAMIAALQAELDALAADTAVRVVVLAGDRPRLLRRPRPEGDARAPRRRVAARAVRRLQPDDADADAAAAAGDRARARHRRRRPAASSCRCATWRSRPTRRGSRCRASTSASSARRRPSGVARNIVAQARDGDAADRRADRRADGAGLGPRQPRRARGRARCRGRAASPDDHRAKSARDRGARQAGVLRSRSSAGCRTRTTLAGEAMACNLLDPDAAEGIDAFLAKRAPRWNVVTPAGRRLRQRHRCIARDPGLSPFSRATHSP